MREQRELGTDDISTIVLGQLADPPEHREQALLAGLRVAEGFRDEGRDVLLLIDAPPSGVPDFGALRPRIGTAGGGSITLLVFDLLLPSTGVELPALAAGDWDTRIVFDVALARRGLYPAIDPLVSTSRLLENGELTPEHASVARRVRSMLQQERSARADAPPDERMLAGRARRIEQFQTQPFFVAQPWTARPGETVPLGETLASYTALAGGAGDAVAEEHFAYRGGLSQVLSPRARGT